MSIEGNAAISKAGASMKAEEPVAPERIGETFRNGSITGVGLILRRYRRAIRFFLAGLILVGVGVAAALAIDIAPLSEGL